MARKPSKIPSSGGTTVYGLNEDFVQAASSNHQSWGCCPFKVLSSEARAVLRSKVPVEE